MGVVCVLNYPVAEGKSGQQTVDLLKARIEQLGATSAGNFSVDCDTYQSTQAQGLPQRMVHVMHNSEQPASCFCVLDTSTCLIADNLMGLLMLKLKDYYKAKNIKIESKGQRYELDDFIIKIGSVVFGQSAAFKGVLVEVEYLPCAVSNDCMNLLKEFVKSFAGNIGDSPTKHFLNKKDLAYGPSDTVLQYLEHFETFRKSAVPMQR